MVAIPPWQGSRPCAAALGGAGDLRRRDRNRGEGLATDDAVQGTRDGGAQRGTGLRLLVLSGGLFRGSRNQERRGSHGEGRTRPRRDPAQGKTSGLSPRA